MAIVLATTDSTVVLVHTSDPDVKRIKQVKEDKPEWLTEDEAKVSDKATRVAVKPLSGLEFNTIATIEDKAKQSLEVLRAGVVSIDGSGKVDKKVLENLPYPLASGLESKILDISLG